LPDQAIGSTQGRTTKGVIMIQRMRNKIKPGRGWTHMKGAVWSHSSGIRIHVSGLLLRLPNGDISNCQSPLLRKLIKINGGNEKRGLMAFVSNRFETL